MGPSLSEMMRTGPDTGLVAQGIYLAARHNDRRCRGASDLLS